MKKFLYILAAAILAVTAYSCSKDAAGMESVEGQGSVVFTIGAAGSTRATLRYPWSEANIRIYKITYAADDTDKENGRKELIRHYFDLDAMPTEMWLVEGDYAIDIVLGDDKKAVSTDHPYYHGYQTFTITRNSSTAVEVECTIQNTIVKVNFDDSVKETFEDYRAVVMVGSVFDTSRTNDPEYSVTYNQSNSRGYFIIPEGSEVLSFCFKGTGADASVRDSGNHHGEGESEPGEIHEHYNGYKLNPEQLTGYCYELTFRYSNDILGYVSWNIEITVADTEVVDDFMGVNPAPKPTITGTGVELEGEAPRVVAGQPQYTVTASDRAISKIEISVDGGEPVIIDCHSEGDKEGGVNIAYTDETGKVVTATLMADFFNEHLAGGEHKLDIRAYTTSTTFEEVKSKIFTDGAYLITPVDKWNATGEMRAYLFSEPDGDVKIRYRLKQNAIATENDGEEWTVVDAAKESDDVYYAEGVTVHADAYYEYQLMVGDRVVGAAKKDVTENGAQIPNAGFEEWSVKNSKVKIPYLLEEEDTNQWWDTGNHGSTTLGANYNISTNETSGIRAGSPGKTYAKLASRYIIAKLAAGNIFIGKYAGTSGTDGVIAFGKPFPFDYKPRALRFWYKSTVGPINRGSGAPGMKTGDPDVNEIYVMLCNMEGPHIVNTTDKTTFVDLTSHTISYCSASSYNANSKNDQPDGHVIASAVWNNTESQPEWTMVELELKYNDEYNSEKPTYLMLTASANKYGDYFMGCDSNVLSLDDIELVY